MKKVVRKVFWAWQAEEEEQWLNEMARDGWVLCEVGWCKYTFEPCEKGEYQFRLEYLANNIGHSESVKYINFIEETGAEYVGHWMRWVYFRQNTAKGDFELHSSRVSKIKYMERVTGLISGLAIANLVIGISNILISLITDTSFNMIGIVNIILAWFLYRGYKKINAKCQKLVEEQQLFE